MLDKIIRIIAPFDCLGCGQEGAALCTACATSLPALPERCYGCSAVSAGQAVCAQCRRRSPLRYVWVGLQYEGVQKELVRTLKFGRARGVAAAMTESMVTSLPHLPKSTILCPVPTASVRVRQRGYDQAVVLARQIARRQSFSCQKLLMRMGSSRQVGADKSTRQEQLKTAFRVRHAHLITGANIVLVDDIVTTGATLEAAARALKKAGAKSVSAVVFAQKQ